MDKVKIEDLLSFYTAAALLAVEGEIEPLREIHGDKECREVLSRIAAFTETLERCNPADFPVIVTPDFQMCECSWRIAAFRLAGAKKVPYVVRTIPGPVEIHDEAWLKTLTKKSQALIRKKESSFAASPPDSPPPPGPLEDQKEVFDPSNP